MGPAIRIPNRISATLVAASLVFLAGCGVNSAKRNYVLAEKLWGDGKYAASVSEFEKVIAKDPTGKLGLMALQRAASTQALFLSQYGEAVRKYRIFAEMSSDKDANWEALKQIGEILFLKTEQYDQAAQHYRSLLKLRPDAVEAPEYLFRIAKSHFFLWQFSDALKAYQNLLQGYPDSPWAERSMYEIGVVHFTRGGQQTGKGSGMEPYQEAREAYERFLKKYPASEWVPQARFGIASCLEELDQLDAAYKAYEELKSTYPSPKVIQIKLYRIRERKTQRNR